eukprot:TRINITY_DN11148_c0_g2_i1.p1 TRINITY_DN11148_c0_g2~~TRINITY_DN11148_c0_g2_i1.p1  ORF type:complete len:827 (+),score=159.95 TRINITY_DN11148_c0_g2_i1:166-2481(+)
MGSPDEHLPSAAALMGDAMDGFSDALDSSSEHGAEDADSTAEVALRLQLEEYAEMEANLPPDLRPAPDVDPQTRLQMLREIADQQFLMQQQEGVAALMSGPPPPGGGGSSAQASAWNFMQQVLAADLDVPTPQGRSPGSAAAGSPGGDASMGSRSPSSSPARLPHGHGWASSAAAADPLAAFLQARAAAGHAIPATQLMRIMQEHLANSLQHIHAAGMGIASIDVDNMSYEELLQLEERIGKVNVGLDKRGIEEVTVSYSWVAGLFERIGAQGAQQCTVCLTEYEKDEQVRLLPCQHLYHAECIDQWLKDCRNCPVCKHDVKEAKTGGDQEMAPSGREGGRGQGATGAHAARGARGGAAGSRGGSRSPARTSGGPALWRSGRAAAAASRDSAEAHRAGFGAGSAAATAASWRDAAGVPQGSPPRGGAPSVGRFGLSGAPSPPQRRWRGGSGPRDQQQPQWRSGSGPAPDGPRPDLRQAWMAGSPPRQQGYPMGGHAQRWGPAGQDPMALSPGGAASSGASPGSWGPAPAAADGQAYPGDGMRGGGSWGSPPRLSAPPAAMGWSYPGPPQMPAAPAGWSFRGEPPQQPPAPPAAFGGWGGMPPQGPGPADAYTPPGQPRFAGAPQPAYGWMPQPQGPPPGMMQQPAAPGMMQQPPAPGFGWGPRTDSPGGQWSPYQAQPQQQQQQPQQPEVGAGGPNGWGGLPPAPLPPGQRSPPQRSSGPMGRRSPPAAAAAAAAAAPKPRRKAKQRSAQHRQGQQQQPDGAMFEFGVQLR